VLVRGKKSVGGGDPSKGKDRESEGLIPLGNGFQKPRTPEGGSEGMDFRGGGGATFTLTEGGRDHDGKGLCHRHATTFSWGGRAKKEGDCNFMSGCRERG